MVRTELAASLPLVAPSDRVSPLRGFPADGTWVATIFSSSASTSGAVKFFGGGPRGLPHWPFLRRLCTVGLRRPA
jgi:hypothetical protein